MAALVCSCLCSCEQANSVPSPILTHHYFFPFQALFKTVYFIGIRNSTNTINQTNMLILKTELGWAKIKEREKEDGWIKYLLPICLQCAGTVQDFFLKRLTSRWDQSHGDKRGSAAICQETRGSGWVQPSDHRLTKEICPWEKVQQKEFKGHFDLLWTTGTSFFLFFC